MREVRVIPAAREFSTGQAINQVMPKRRVAGYARVSTDRDDQFTSYEAQVDYYTTMIKSKAEWEFAGIYTDEGISGTSTARREGFKQMVADALAGKIDLIVTKSVSRFARNTVDSLTTIRKLKDKKVEVFFEKESIWTFDSKGELLITIMSSLAQEESRSISENVKWGRRKRFADGQVTVPFTRFLGYDKGPDGNLVVNNEQAKLVRYIFALYLQGLSTNAIAKHLEDGGYKTVTGKKVWHSSTVARVLCNEKYKGDALLQKYYIADFLTKRPVENKGEVPQYYVHDNHEAIIPCEVFDLVQKEIRNRRRHAEKGKGPGIFPGRIHCGVCGGIFGPKVWHSNDRYRKVIWQCNDKYAHKGKTCTAPNFSEDELKAMFARAVNKLISGREEIIGNFNKIKDGLFDTSAQEAELERLKEERVEIVSLMEKLTNENASVVMAQSEYRARFDNLSGRYAKVKDNLVILEDTIKDKQYRKTKTDLFLKTLKKQNALVSNFSGDLWHALADHVTVYSKEDVRFTFRNGMEIRI
jgi:DNA invertase Pin-like site-specific DNA recombinase